MYHSETCVNLAFSKDHDSKQKDHLKRGFMAAACCVVCDIDNKVLLTRRADTMSFFRRAWVIPGGHVDPGEHLEEAALRELHEECGLLIKDGMFEGIKVEVCILCAFESSTPGRSSTLPGSSHLIIFYKVKLPVRA